MYQKSYIMVKPLCFYAILKKIGIGLDKQIFKSKIVFPYPSV